MRNLLTIKDYLINIFPCTTLVQWLPVISKPLSQRFLYQNHVLVWGFHLACVNSLTKGVCTGWCFADQTKARGAGTRSSWGSWCSRGKGLTVGWGRGARLGQGRLGLIHLQRHQVRNMTKITYGKLVMVKPTLSTLNSRPHLTRLTSLTNEKRKKNSLRHCKSYCSYLNKLNFFFYS